MRKLMPCLLFLLTFVSTLLPLVGHAQGIVLVLQRSQQLRLDQRAAPDLHSAASDRLRASFERLLALAPQQGAPTLRIVGGEVFAEALFGPQVVAASEAVGTLPEGERLLMLAHELGHLALHHWDSLSGLYVSHIPGEVRPETTDPVAARLSREATALSHRHEFEADAYGYEIARKLGYGMDNAVALLTRQGMQFESPTHPGTRRRFANLRLVEAQAAQGTLSAGAAETVAVQASP